MKMTDLIKIAKTEISNSNKLCIIAGLNVLEDDQLTFKVAERLKKITVKNNRENDIWEDLGQVNFVPLISDNY